MPSLLAYLNGTLASYVQVPITTSRSSLLEYFIVPPMPTAAVHPVRVPWELGGLEELFQAYAIRYYTAEKIAKLGFTVSTLVDMKDDELDDMMNSLSQIFRWDLLVRERYGIKAAVRAERRHLDEEEMRQCNPLSADTTTTHPLDALSQEGLSEELVVQHKKEVVATAAERRNQQEASKRRTRMKITGYHHDENDDPEDEHEGNNINSTGRSYERQREHPFIVTQPGEVARGKKNGLDYLFHLYEQCSEFLIQVQNIAKQRSEKCPTKVFRYAKKAGASYINKPKMRHYVHCYALHYVDEDVSNELRRAFNERGKNVGAWRQACYKPLVIIDARQANWAIDAIFNAHARLSIWYVPTKLCQLYHVERNSAAVPNFVSIGGAC